VKRTTVFAGMVIVAILAMAPAASAGVAFTWIGNVTYCSNGTLVPDNWDIYMTNPGHPEFFGQPWHFVTVGSLGYWNAHADGEKLDDNDWIWVNVTNHNGCVGEFTARLGDIYDPGNGFYVKDFCVTCTTPDIDWPQFHYDIANTGNTPAVAPDDNQTKWETADIGAVEGSQAMIKDGKVFVYANDYVRALSTADGTSVWNDADPNVGHIYGDTSGFGSWASPAYSDGKLYVSSGYNISRIDASTGNVEQLVAFPDGGHSCNGGPTVEGGVVYAGSGYGNPTAHYYALDASDLTIEIWNLSVGTDNAGSTPAITGDKVIFGNGSSLTCVDKNSAGPATVLWTNDLGSGTILGSAAIDSANDRVYVATGSGSQALLHALDLDGNLIWTSSTAFDFTDGTPAFMDMDHVYISGNNYGSPGHTYCFNSTGDLQWTVDRGSWVMSPAVTADGKLITGDCDDMGGWGFFEGTGAYNATTGALIWEYAYGGSSPSVANSDPMVVSIGKNGKVYAFGTPTASSVTVEMDDHTMSPSGTLVAPIWIKGIEDYGAATITVEYNNSVVIVADVDDGPFSEVVASNIDNTLGKVRISAENVHGVDDNIEFARITFNAVGTYDEDATLNLSVQKLVDVNYTTIINSVNNGSITLKETDPPVISNETATPVKIIQTNLTGRARPASRAISTLSADVVDLGSGVDTVTIDLSPIGRSATTSMTAVGSTYSIDTNAVGGIGLNQLHNLIVTATDNNGNLATSTIALEVLIRGDVVRGTGTTVEANVNIGDALYIARHTVGLEPEADNWLLVGDVVGEAGDPTGDDLVDMADALYIVRYALGEEDEP